MNKSTWTLRLAAQLPGWHVWWSSGGGNWPRWSAVPAPPDIDHTAALELPGRIGANTPQELRALARQRYGWDDYCQTCVGMLARDCGHFSDETPSKP